MGMKLTLRIWRQRNAADKGRMVSYDVDGVSPDMSFLEMLDVLNERLILDGEDPVAFDHDCREGICGMCSLVIDGTPHGPQRATTTCQLHMRHFEDGDVITIEPWRAAAFPVVKDLVVDRSAFDRIIQAGGYVSAPTGVRARRGGRRRCRRPTRTTRSTPPPASAAARASPPARTPPRCCSPPRRSPTWACCRRASPSGTAARPRMVAQMDAEGFGGCTNTGECTAVCPKGIPLDTISRLNADLLKAAARSA